MPRHAGLSFACVCAERVAEYYTCTRWDNYGRHYQHDISKGVSLAAKSLENMEGDTEAELRRCLTTAQKAVELSGASLAREPARLVAWRSASAVTLLLESVLYGGSPIWSTRQSLMVLSDVVRDKSLLLRTFVRDFHSLRLVQATTKLPLWPVGIPADWRQEPPVYGEL
jgi:hypothetical protein